MWICPVQGPLMGTKRFSFSETASALLIPCLPCALQIPACPACPWPCSHTASKRSQFTRTILTREGVPASATPRSHRTKEGIPGASPSASPLWQHHSRTQGSGSASAILRVPQGGSSRAFPGLGVPDAPGHILCPAPRAPASRSVSPVV